jgi:Tfp pilus assembly protein FimT
MTLPTGNRPISGSSVDQGTKRPRPRQSLAFTLIELILVMSMLVIALSVASPSLSRFFRGRSLDSEVKRFLALTRFGQSRAVSEGVPVLLWIDAKEGSYGLQVDSSYVEEDPKALEYDLHKDVQVEVQQSVLAQKQSALWKGRGGLASNLPKIRFTPDGFIGPSSPELIVFRQGDDGAVWIGTSRSHLNYEIQTNQFQRLNR